MQELTQKLRNPRLQEFIKELMEAARHSVSTLSQGPGTQTPTANARKVFLDSPVSKVGPLFDRP